MKKNIMLLLITLILSFSSQSYASKNDSSQSTFFESTQTDKTNLLAQYLKTDFKKVNFRCGLKPFPPLGCTVGSCVCDQSGRNCQWTFICR